MSSDERNPDQWLRIEKMTVCRGDKKVLKEIDLAIGSGELVAIVGANGSGKSTLLATLLGQVSPSSGTIRTDGTDLSSLREIDRASLFAWLPQESSVAEPLLVEEVVAAARYHFDEPRHTSLKEAREALRQSGAGDLMHRW